MGLKKKLLLIFISIFAITIALEIVLSDLYFQDFFYFMKDRELKKTTFLTQGEFNSDLLKKYQLNHEAFAIVIKDKKILNLDNFDRIEIQNSDKKYTILLSSLVNDMIDDGGFDLEKGIEISVVGEPLIGDIIIPFKLSLNNKNFYDSKFIHTSGKLYKGKIISLKNSYKTLELSSTFIENAISLDLSRNIFMDIFDSNNLLKGKILSEKHGDYQIVLYHSFENMKDIFPTLKSFFLLKTFIVIIFIFIFEKIISKIFIKPIISLSEITKEIEQLNFNKPLSIDREDEIGMLYKTIFKMRESLKNVINLYRIELQSSQNNQVELEEKIKLFMHEIKTPLSAIIGFSDILLEEKFSDEIAIINTEGKNLLSLADQLIEKESPEIDLNYETFNINSLIDLSIKISKLHQKKVTFNFCNDSIFLVEADKGKIEQVIFNILNNAIHFAKDKIFISLKDDDENVYISFENNGPKLLKDEEKKIWQKFYSKNGKDRGLGLYIAAKILKAHNSIYIARNSNLGVCFEFSLKKSKMVI